MRPIILGLLLLAAVISCSANGLIPDEDLDRILDESEELHRSLIPTNPTRRHYKKRVSPELMELGIRAAAFAHAADNVAKVFNVSHKEAERHLQARATVRKTGVALGNGNTCVMRNTAPACVTNSKYRTFDGSCNNLNQPTFGMAVTPFDRFAPPNYADGVGALRRRADGSAFLPARYISNIMTDDGNAQSSIYTSCISSFGQFLDHDMTSTPEFANMQCCQNTQNPQCMPIDVPRNDEFYSQFNVSCIDVGRSIPACGTSPREQMDQVTHFIDGSQIYGSSDAEQASLRNGIFLLIDTANPAFNRLPQDPTAQNCGVPANGITCFKAGDDRVNENPTLTVQHTLWMREHNRIAQLLRNQKPSWTDDKVFQETRRIIYAELENIVYSEFLPALLGTNTMNNFGLFLVTSGFSTYDPSVLPVIFNEFSTAAYRLHTHVPGAIPLSNGATSSLTFNFQNPQLIQQSNTNIERILLGNTQQPAQQFDNFIAEPLTNHLFQRPNANLGSDLAALNIQRGRDHGLRGYNDYRRACGLSPIVTFQDMVNLFGIDDANRLSDSYGTNLEDVELWPAGICEAPVAGGFVGPTFACIIGAQYRRLLYGDRYFFTHGGQAGSFTTGQLQILRARTLSSVICDNANPSIITSMPLNSFRLGQTIVACANHPKLNNFTLWT